MKKTSASDKSVKVSTLVAFATFIFVLGLGWGCSTQVKKPMAPLPPQPPEYVRVPHPEGFDQGDIRSLFISPDAPEVTSLMSCDQSWRKLKERTSIREEIAQGALELVKARPVDWHWCFYGKMLELENRIQETPFIDERQKAVLDTYEFLSSIAQAYHEAFHDPRYRWAALGRYQKLSEFVFFRKLEIQPHAAEELSRRENPFGLLRNRKDPEESILEKYGLLPEVKVVKPSASDSPALVETEEPLRFPAQEPQDSEVDAILNDPDLDLGPVPQGEQE